MSDSSWVIRSRRLDLVPMSPDLMRALRGADWPGAARLVGADIPQEWREQDWQWIEDRPERAEADPSLEPWLPKMLLLREPAGPAVVVGEIGFHGPPDYSGRAEFGYMVVAEHRRQGFAEEAARALLSSAAAELRITRFQACINPQNVPSLNLIRKLGFVQVGAQHHERHGEELIFHRDEIPLTGLLHVL